MATEHLQPDCQISGAPPATTTATATAHPPDPPPLENPAAAATATKRQRRPSVRLGEIGGDPSYDAPHRRPNKTWRFHKDPSLALKTSKTRPLTNLVNGGADSNFLDSVEVSENFGDLGHRKSKIKKPTKRARTNWNKFESATANNGGGGGGASAAAIESTSYLQEENDNNNEELRVLEGEGEGEGSEKEQQSPNSEENMGLQFWDQHRGRNRVSEMNGVHINEVNSANLGVKEWLIGLGLGRYAPVFEIHEVDDEVLPMLTMEDLKDMGINAVGSRRKMYASILKLQKRFS